VVAEPSIAALKGTGSKIKVYQDSAVLLFFIKVNSIRSREWFFQNVISSEFPIRYHPLKSMKKKSTLSNTVVWSYCTYRELAAILMGAWILWQELNKLSKQNEMIFEVEEKRRHDLTTRHACLQRSLSQLIGEYPLTSKRVPWFKSGNCQKTNEQAFQLFGYFHQLEQNARPQIFYYKQLTKRTNSGSTMKGNNLLKIWRKPLDSISLQLWKAAQFGHHAKGDLALNQPRITHFCVQQSTLEMKESQKNKKKSEHKFN
jgi:hypothetical protein